MSLTFIHTADWQIGRPFATAGMFDERKRTLLREARLTAIDRIATAAEAHAAMHVLVAGDVFDSPTIADLILRQTLARLAKHGHLTWHLLPGNHDPLRAAGVWDRLARIGLPANVIVHATAAPVPLGPTAVLLPAPLTASASGHDPTAWMDAATTSPGIARIGLAHGSVRGFGSDGEAAQQISPSRARSAGLAYLALGDWHGVMRVSDQIWYSGTPEPDRYPDNEPGFVLAVQICDAAGSATMPVSVTRVPVGQYRWEERTVILEQASDWDRLSADLAKAATSSGVAADRHLIKLILRGALTLSERAVIQDSVAALEPAFFHLEVDDTQLHDRAGDGDLDGLSDVGVRAIAAELQALALDAQGNDQDVARHALRKLMRLDAQIAAQAAREGA